MIIEEGRNVKRRSTSFGQNCVMEKFEQRDEEAKGCGQMGEEWSHQVTYLKQHISISLVGAGWYGFQLHSNQ